jgi:hypothetical protein
MPAPGGGRTLEIDEDLDSQRRRFRVADAASLAFVGIALMAVLGFLGPGPLGDARVSDADDHVSVVYQRFLRFGTSTALDVEIRSGAVTTELALEQSYLAGFDLEGVVPEPDRQTASGGRVRFTFEERAPSTVTISLTPREIGVQRASVTVGERRTPSFRQLVYP